MLSSLPDITFVETDPEKIIADKINDYENAYFESTGTRKQLYPGDPIRIFLYTEALREIQLRHIIDETGKQNLLKYARNENLDHLGARVKTPRRKAKPSFTRMKLKFSQARQSISIIPKGTRFSPQTNIYFETDKTYELAIGEQELIVSVVCTEAGSLGNGFLLGQLNVIVDPLPFLIEAINIDVTQGGEDLEDDELYREKIYNAPEGLSVAGPEGAYKFHTKAYSSQITDVRVTSPTPGVVDIRVLLQDGELPSRGFLEGLEAYFDKEKRPLTDKVIANVPDVIKYNIDVKYYVAKTDIENLERIQLSVNAALKDYIKWQKSKIGRDINDSELIFLLRRAGAKRVDVVTPKYTPVDANTVAHADVISMVYGGLEDD